LNKLYKYIKIIIKKKRDEKSSNKRTLDFYSTLSKKIKLSLGPSNKESDSRLKSSGPTINNTEFEKPRKLISILSNPNKPKKRKHVSFKPDGMLNNYYVFETEKEIDDRYEDGYKQRKYGNARDMDRNEGYNAFSRMRNEMKQTIEYYTPKLMAIPVIEEKAKRSQEKEFQKEYESDKNEVYYLSNSLIPNSPDEPDGSFDKINIELKPSVKSVTQVIQLWNDEVKYIYYIMYNYYQIPKMRFINIHVFIYTY